jgi:hypothetical protein
MHLAVFSAVVSAPLSRKTRPRKGPVKGRQTRHPGLSLRRHEQLGESERPALALRTAMKEGRRLLGHGRGRLDSAEGFGGGAAASSVASVRSEPVQHEVDVATDAVGGELGRHGDARKHP